MRRQALFLFEAPFTHNAHLTKGVAGSSKLRPICNIFSIGLPFRPESVTMKQAESCRFRNPKEELS